MSAALLAAALASSTRTPAPPKPGATVFTAIGAYDAGEAGGPGAAWGAGTTWTRSPISAVTLGLAALRGFDEKRRGAVLDARYELRLGVGLDEELYAILGAGAFAAQFSGKGRGYGLEAATGLVKNRGKRLFGRLDFTMRRCLRGDACDAGAANASVTVGLGWRV